MLLLLLLLLLQLLLLLFLLLLLLLPNCWFWHCLTAVFTDNGVMVIAEAHAAES